MVIYDNFQEIGILANIENTPDGLHFYTEDINTIQFAGFRYNKGHVMRAHRHIFYDTEWERIKTQEVLVVWKGKVKLTIFNRDDKILTTFELNKGDFYISLFGGVRYDVLEDDTILMEFKTGPFPGSEKDRILIDEG
jgi:hypothetical protein